jgi:hypothetical protein
MGRKNFEYTAPTKNFGSRNFLVTSRRPVDNEAAVIRSLSFTISISRKYAAETIVLECGEMLPKNEPLIVIV